MPCTVPEEVLLTYNLLILKMRKYSWIHTFPKLKVNLTLKMSLCMVDWILSQIGHWWVGKESAFEPPNILPSSRTSSPRPWLTLSSQPQLSPGKRKGKGHHMGPGDASIMTAKRQLSFVSPAQAASWLKFPKEDRDDIHQHYVNSITNYSVNAEIIMTVNES